jgi:hypothetical protein
MKELKRKPRNWYKQDGKFIAVFEFLKPLYARYNRFILFLYEKYKEESEIWEGNIGEEVVISEGKVIVIPTKLKIKNRICHLIPSKIIMKIYDTKQDFMI